MTPIEAVTRLLDIVATSGNNNQLPINYPVAGGSIQTQLKEVHSAFKQEYELSILNGRTELARTVGFLSDRNENNFAYQRLTPNSSIFNNPLVVDKRYVMTEHELSVMATVHKQLVYNKWLQTLSNLPPNFSIAHYNYQYCDIMGTELPLFTTQVDIEGYFVNGEWVTDWRSVVRYNPENYELDFKQHIERSYIYMTVKQLHKDESPQVDVPDLSALRLLYGYTGLVKPYAGVTKITGSDGTSGRDVLVIINPTNSVQELPFDTKTALINDYDLTYEKHGVITPLWGGVLDKRLVVIAYLLDDSVDYRKVSLDEPLLMDVAVLVSMVTQ